MYAHDQQRRCTGIIVNEKAVRFLYAGAVSDYDAFLFCPFLLWVGDIDPAKEPEGVRCKYGRRIYSMLDQSYYQKADEIIASHGRKSSSLIPIMQDIQEEYRYLPGELLTYVAGQIGVTEAKAYSVATFYENFSFEAKGKYVIKVCDGTACHVRKSMPVLDAINKKLGLSKNRKTTSDMLFTVETVSCLGACGLAPTMMVNDEVYPRMTPEAAEALIDRLKGGEGA